MASSPHCSHQERARCGCALPSYFPRHHCTQTTHRGRRFQRHKYSLQYGIILILSNRHTLNLTYYSYPDIDLIASHTSSLLLLTQSYYYAILNTRQRCTRKHDFFSSPSVPLSFILFFTPKDKNISQLHSIFGDIYLYRT